MRTHRRSSLWLALLVAGVALGAGCNPEPLQLEITSPQHGIFTTASSVQLTGTVSHKNLDVVTVTVNGVPTAFDPNGDFSQTISLDPAEVFNPIHVVANSGQQIVAERVVVIAGESVADGDYSLNSIALRLNDSGLDSVEPLVSSLVDLDIATLLPVGTVIIDDECMIDGGFLGCLGRATVSIQNPPPSFSSFGLDVDSQTGFAAGDVVINDVQVDAYIDGTGTVPNCGLRLTASSVSIFGDYTLEPDAVDPETIDVNLLGSPGVSFTGFNDQFTSGLCDAPIIGDIIQLIIGDIQPIVINGLVGFLADPDGGGPQDAPIAEGIEVALADIQIAGPIGEGLGVDLQAPLFGVFEDVNGLTLGSDGRVTTSFGTGPGQCDPPAGSPDLGASYHVPEPFPSFGPNTPVGGLPYGLGICISSSAFNQLLKAQIECGLLNVTLTELDLFGSGTPQPVTAGFLALLIAEFGNAEPSTPLRIEVRPTLAPVLTGNPGPSGELTEMRVGGLQIAVVTDDAAGTTLISAGIDFRTGLDFAFDDATGELLPTLGAVQSEEVTVGIINDTIGANPASVELILQTLLPVLLPEVADVLASFPLPSFLGLQLQSVEVGANGEFISIFTDLVSAPPDRAPVPERSRIVLVTGASSGIGAATTRAFAARGDTVVAVARRAERLEALVEGLVQRQGDGGEGGSGGSTPLGRDVNGMVCAFPDGSGRFVAGEDTGQPSPPAGWGIFAPDGSQVGKLTATYQRPNPEPYGCAFNSEGILFTTSTGDPGIGPGNGQLLMWFPPYQGFSGAPGTWPNDALSGSFCKLAVDVATATGIAIDAEDNVYVASGGVLQVQKFAPPFPTGLGPGQGCEARDAQGSPLADAVDRTVAIQGQLLVSPFSTFTGLAMAPNGNLYAASIFDGTIGEFDLDAPSPSLDDTLVRTILPLVSRPSPLGSPQGLAVGADGTLYYADLDLVGTFPDLGPGPDGKVRRIRFDDHGDPLPPEMIRDGLAFPDGVALLPGHLPSKEWRTYAGGPGRRFHNPDEFRLGPADAGNLVERWRFPTGAIVTASPVVARLELPGAGVESVAFVQSWDGNVYAVRTRDGTELWRFATEPQAGANFPNTASAHVERMAGRETVFIGSGHVFHALDAVTGEEIWRFVVGSGCRDVDDDLDGLVDGADDGCSHSGDTTERPDCPDGVDNDHDGLDDFPADPGCDSLADGSESGSAASPLLACGLLGAEPFLLLGGLVLTRRGRQRTGSSRAWSSTDGRC